MPKSHAPYPEAFRADAIRLYHTSGKSIEDIAEDLGISRESLRKWVQQAKADAGEGQTTTEELPGPVTRRVRSRPDENYTDTRTWFRRVALVLIGILRVIALAYIAVSLHRELDNANTSFAAAGQQGPSAIQIIQVYTESLYRAIIAIGIGMAAYFATRALD